MSLLWAIFFSLERLHEALGSEILLELEIAPKFGILVSSFGDFEIPGLLIGLSLKVIETRPRIIHIGQLGEVLIPITGHFEYGHHNGKVISSSEILPTVIFQIPNTDPPIQVHKEGPEMRGWEYTKPPE